LIPAILGGGEVIADALVLGTPRIGVTVGISVAAGEGEDVSVGVDVVNGAAQAPSKITPRARVNNNAFILI
jgi:hypothetical protein